MKVLKSILLVCASSLALTAFGNPEAATTETAPASPAHKKAKMEHKGKGKKSAKAEGKMTPKKEEHAAPAAATETAPAAHEEHKAEGEAAPAHH